MLHGCGVLELPFSVDTLKIYFTYPNLCDVMPPLLGMQLRRKAVDAEHDDISVLAVNF